MSMQTKWCNSFAKCLDVSGNHLDNFNFLLYNKSENIFYLLYKQCLFKYISMFNIKEILQLEK